MNRTAGGVGLLLLAGAMNGSFALPMKFTKRWAWENTWFFWTLFALLIFPPLFTFLTVPAIGAVYREASRATLWAVVSFSAAWGISQVFFGLAVDAIGMALSFSVILGISAALGSIIPLVRLHPAEVLASEGLAVYAGVLLVLVGVGICAVAGRRREAKLGRLPAKASVAIGLLFSVISGAGSALVNLVLTFGDPLVDLARRMGTPARWAPNAVWLPLTVIGGIPNLIYCLYLMRKNKTGRQLGAGGAGHIGLAVVMGLFWFFSLVTYGIASGMMGSLGAVLGWPLYMSLIVIAGTLWGVVTGEWRNAGRETLRIMWGGVGVLVAAIFVLATGGRWF
jgi:L-rhamnose-H+ transport protein